MEVTDLEYSALKLRIKSIEDGAGLGESAAFLVWFLEHVYRLEETAARDAVCDHSNDKGIDGIYVDDNNEQVHFLQSKIKQQKGGTIGDVEPKTLMGSVRQFDSEEKVAAVLAGNAHADLKALLVAQNIAGLVAKGYTLHGVFVSNALHDKNSREVESVLEDLHIYDRTEIAARVIDLDAAKVKKDTFTFDTSYVKPLSMQAGAGNPPSTMYLFPARALQLVHMDGIGDGSLFEDNVRYALGNSSVNRAIGKSVADRKEHGDFALFHNGIIILCDEVDDSVAGALTVRGYGVVNGAQSLTQFFINKEKLTDDLRVLVRVIAVKDETLAKKITANSNNQNAIRPRDSRSNHAIQMTLQAEVAAKKPGYFFDIKRGAKVPEGSTVISNDTIGRALLAFDLGEPWSAHQIYKVFDEKYSQIFGGPEVGADRIVFVHRLIGAVDSTLELMKNRPMASYTLTRYFVLYVLSQILREHGASRKYVSDPSALDDIQMDDFVARCQNILKTVVVELDYQSREEEFDYKTVLKNQTVARALAQKLLIGYEKDVAIERAVSFDGWEPPTEAA